MIRARLHRLAFAAAAATSAGSTALAQEPPQGQQPYTIEKSVAIDGIYTDNARLSADRRKDFIGRLSVGLHGLGQYGTARGSFDYTLTGIAYAKESDLNGVSHYLRAALSNEFVPRHLYVDATASVGQAATSLRAPESSDRARLTDTSTRLYTASVSPHGRFRLGNVADADVRYTRTQSHAESSDLYDVESDRAFARLSGELNAFGWNLDGAWDRSSNGVGIDNESRLIEAGLTATVTRGLRVTLLAGRESNDYRGLGMESRNTWGGRFAWDAGERTSVSGHYRRRIVGHEHSLTLSHRTVSTVWSFSDSRAVNTAAMKGAIGTTLYDLYFAQFAGTEPDPVRRDIVVRDYLRTLGLDPSTPVVNGFLAAGASVDRTQSLGVAWLGPRSTAAFRVFQTQSELTGQRVPLADDFASADRLRQQGVTLDLSHRLTPVMSISLVGEYRRSKGDRDVLSDYKAVTGAWTARLGERSDMSVGVRHAVSNATVQPFKETSVFAGYRVRF